MATNKKPHVKSIRGKKDGRQQKQRLPMTMAIKKLLESKQPNTRAREIKRLVNEIYNPEEVEDPKTKTLQEVRKNQTQIQNKKPVKPSSADSDTSDLMISNLFESTYHYTANGQSGTKSEEKTETESDKVPDFIRDVCVEDENLSLWNFLLHLDIESNQDSKPSRPITVPVKIKSEQTSEAKVPEPTEEIVSTGSSKPIRSVSPSRSDDFLWEKNSCRDFDYSVPSRFEDLYWTGVVKALETPSCRFTPAEIDYEVKSEDDESKDTNSTRTGQTDKWELEDSYIPGPPEPIDIQEWVQSGSFGYVPPENLGLDTPQKATEKSEDQPNVHEVNRSSSLQTSNLDGPSKNPASSKRNEVVAEALAVLKTFDSFKTLAKTNCNSYNTLSKTSYKSQALFKFCADSRAKGDSKDKEDPVPGSKISSGPKVNNPSVSSEMNDATYLEAHGIPLEGQVPNDETIALIKTCLNAEPGSRFELTYPRPTERVAKPIDKDLLQLLDLVHCPKLKLIYLDDDTLAGMKATAKLSLSSGNAPETIQSSLGQMSSITQKPEKEKNYQKEPRANANTPEENPEIPKALKRSIKAPKTR